MPLSFGNSDRVGDKPTMDERFQEAATWWRPQWHKEKVWNDGVHLGVEHDRREDQSTGRRRQQQFGTL